MFPAFVDFSAESSLGLGLRGSKIIFKLFDLQLALHCFHLRAPFLNVDLSINRYID